MKKVNISLIAAILNVFALMVYFFILPRLVALEAIPDNLFSTTDAKEYRDYGQWITGTGGHFVPYRTFFYPLLVYLITALAGSYGLWIMQLIFWFASCNFVFYTLLSLTNLRWAAVCGFIVCCTNISLIGYTSHALCETLILLLLSAFLFTLAKNIHQLKNINAQLWLLGIVSLLAATKPLYQTLWYVCVLLFIISGFRSFKQFRIILTLLLVLSPVMIQKGINLVTQRTLSSTQIADSNLKKYFYRKIKFYADRGNINDFNYLPDSVHTREKKAAALLSTGDVVEYLADHPKQTLIVFWDDIKTNIGVGYPFPGTKGNENISAWSNKVNILLLNFHVAAFIMWLLFILLRIKGSSNPNYLFILISGIFLYSIFLSSGLVFWAGDRLVAPAITLWVCCYFMIGYDLFHFFVPGKKSSVPEK